ncbi:MAG: hypothetical protein IPH45_11510 [Bacteroidales bacterium]|nr:hypothetical protein [Bacteroidales bacterium]
MKTFSTALKSLTLLIIALLSGLLAFSQTQDPVLIETEPRKPWSERLFYGGSLGLQFGSVTLVDISPLIGYKITPRIGVTTTGNPMI